MSDKRLGSDKSRGLWLGRCNGSRQTDEAVWQKLLESNDAVMCVFCARTTREVENANDGRATSGAAMRHARRAMCARALRVGSAIGKVTHAEDERKSRSKTNRTACLTIGRRSMECVTRLGLKIRTRGHDEVVPPFESCLARSTGIMGVGPLEESGFKRHSGRRRRG